MLKIAALDKLIHELSQLPGIGEKTAQRLSYFILRSEGDYTSSLSSAIKNIKSEVFTCTQCFSYTSTEGLCEICESDKRDSHLLCIVEEPLDILKVENSGVFTGKYHVLQGAISPLEGILPDHLKIKDLVQRVENGVKGQGPVIKEVILALDADLEGDTTALYIAKQLKNKGLNLTRIAHGVPFGSDIDYIDKRTLGRALENRVEI